MANEEHDGGQAYALLAQQLDQVGGTLNELKGMLRELAVKVENLEKREIGCQATLQIRVDAAHQRLDKTEQAVKTIDERQARSDQVMQRLQVAYGILVFVGSAFMLSMVTLIWALVTGEAMVVFR